VRRLRKESRLKVFTSKGCGPCKQLKDWLSGKNIIVEYVDVAEAREEIMALGVRAVPALVDGSNVLVGFEPICKYLNGE
jgi:glutaredoxin